MRTPHEIKQSGTKSRFMSSEGSVDGGLYGGGVVDRELRHDLVHLLVGVVEVEGDGVLEPVDGILVVEQDVVRLEGVVDGREGVLQDGAGHGHSCARRQ